MYTKKDKWGGLQEYAHRKGAHNTATDKAKNLTSKSKKEYGREGESTNMKIKK